MSRVGVPYSWYAIGLIIIICGLRIDWMFKGVGKNGDYCSELTNEAHEKDNFDFDINRITDFTTPYTIAKSIYSHPEIWERVG